MNQTGPDEPASASHRDLPDHLLEGCRVLGFDWRCRYLNPAAQKHNRRPDAELIGRRLRLSTEQLVQAQKPESVGRLVGGVAHDVNNLLSAIMGHAEMAMEDACDDDAMQAHLRLIGQAARRSAGCRQWSRIRAGVTRIDNEARYQFGTCRLPGDARVRDLPNTHHATMI